jgi:hypothetical protein
MAHVIHGPFHGASLSQVDAEKSADETRRTLLTGTTIAISIVVLLLLALTAYFVASRSSHTAAVPSHAAPIAAKATSLVQPAAPLSAAELKAVKDRDDYAVSLTKLLHQKLPEYKRVSIFADNWAGSHAPTLSAPRDVKTRTGDNLMMVFWSPDSGTARSLADFTKSKAAQEAVNYGYEEFQFVDSSSYCFALVAPSTGVGPVTCGIR